MTVCHKLTNDYSVSINTNKDVLISCNEHYDSNNDKRECKQCLDNEIRFDNMNECTSILNEKEYLGSTMYLSNDGSRMAFSFKKKRRLGDPKNGSYRRRPAFLLRNATFY